MKEVAVAIFNAVGKIGVTYLICACITGADVLIPHKYIVYKDNKTYVTNKNPLKH